MPPKFFLNILKHSVYREEAEYGRVWLARIEKRILESSQQWFYPEAIDRPARLRFDFIASPFVYVVGIEKGRPR